MPPPAVSRILGVRFVRPFVRENRDFSDFRITFFGGWQPPQDPATGFLRSLWMSRKDSGEFWCVLPDVAHQGALNLCYIIANPPKSTKIFENLQNFDFPEIAPRYFLRVPGASTALWDPPRASFSAGFVESRDQPPLFEKALSHRINLMHARVRCGTLPRHFWG